MTTATAAAPSGLARTDIITTIAGPGRSGFSGDGGPATSAQLSLWGGGVAADGHGNVYIVDDRNQRLREVSRDGKITTIVGTGVRSGVGDGGPATAATLANPGGVAIDGQGNIYIADAINLTPHVVRKVTPDGTITTPIPDGNPRQLYERGAGHSMRSKASIDRFSDGRA